MPLLGRFGKKSILFTAFQSNEIVFNETTQPSRRGSQAVCRLSDLLKLVSCRLDDLQASHFYDFIIKKNFFVMLCYIKFESRD